jgi:hypothetical protein
MEEAINELNAAYAFYIITPSEENLVKFQDAARMVWFIAEGIEEPPQA